jgi:hypothetical protein
MGRHVSRNRHELKALNPNSAVFYASGHASLETSYMYVLFARMYGTNNLPDSSNMCHEPPPWRCQNRLVCPLGRLYLMTSGPLT